MRRAASSSSVRRRRERRRQAHAPLAEPRAATTCLLDPEEARLAARERALASMACHARSGQPVALRWLS